MRSGIRVTLGWAGLVVLAGGAAAAPAPPPVRWHEVEALEAAGEPEAALALLPEETTAGPAADALRLARTRVALLHRLGRHPEAQEAGWRWLALAEEGADLDQRIAAHRALGRSLAAQDRHDEAAVQFRRGLELCGPADDSARAGWLRLDLAHSLSAGGEFVEAEQLLRRVEASPETVADPPLVRQLSLPFILADTPPVPPRPSGPPGADNAAILAELGFDPEELEAAGAFSSETQK